MALFDSCDLSGLRENKCSPNLSSPVAFYRQKIVNTEIERILVLPVKLCSRVPEEPSLSSLIGTFHSSAIKSEERNPCF